MTSPFITTSLASVDRLSSGWPVRSPLLAPVREEAASKLAVPQPDQRVAALMSRNAVRRNIGMPSAGAAVESGYRAGSAIQRPSGTSPVYR